MGANSRRRREKRAQREQNPMLVKQDESQDIFSRHRVFPSPQCPPEVQEEHRFIMSAMLSEYDGCTRAVGIMAATKAWHDCYDGFASGLPKEIPSHKDRRVHLRLACDAGCNHCCAQPVVATSSEVAFIAQVISVNFNGEYKAALAQRIAERQASLRENGARRHMCPLNVDGKCSVYGARPLNCRTYHSFDVNACIRNFRRDEPVDMPTHPPRSDQPHYVFSASADLVFTALKLDVRGVDLIGALEIALKTENVLERIAAGEDIFGAARVPS